jgi:DNA-binding SARP family transcriptional activator
MAPLRRRYAGRVVVDLRLLGPLEATRNGADVPLPGVKLRSVLATLTLNAGEAVSVDRLADVLWADAPPQTLMTQIQAQISALRRRLDPEHAPGAASELIATRPPGYRLNPAAASIDLRRFEDAMREGREALAAGLMDPASACFRRGLEMWRGAALADLPRESFGGEAARLEDLRLAAWEQAIDADLALGRHDQLQGELEVLCAEHPYRETLWAKRMLALYRCGRQADALAAFRAARRRLVGDLGIEPGDHLRVLEGAILRQDPSLGVSVSNATAPPEQTRRVLVSGTPADLPSLIEVAGALSDGELLAVGHVAADADLVQATRDVRDACAQPASRARVRAAAFRSRNAARDLARLAQEQNAELVVVRLGEDGVLPLELLSGCPADVALVDVRALDRFVIVMTPFTGTTHDWAALALSGRVAAALALPLELVGVDAGDAGDASRVLASAALALARVAEIDAVPRLVRAAPGALAGAAADDGLVVTGVPEGYRRVGLGPARQALVERARGRAVLVHAGPRPGVLAPAGSSTRFTWSLAGASG